MPYTDKANMAKLHLVMLSHDIKDGRMVFYINRPFDYALRVINPCGPQGQPYITVLAMSSDKNFRHVYQSHTSDYGNSFVEPKEDGTVMLFQLLLAAYDSTLNTIICELGNELGEILDISPWDVMLSHRYGHPEPRSCYDLMVSLGPLHVGSAEIADVEAFTRDHQDDFALA